MSSLKICRICLRTEAKMYKYDTFQLKYYYEEITASKVNEDDDLPQTFCYECATYLYKFRMFKEKCFNGQRALKEIQWRGAITYEEVYKIDRQNRKLSSSLSLVSLPDKVEYVPHEHNISLLKQERHKDFDDYDCLSNKDSNIHEIDVEKVDKNNTKILYSQLAGAVDIKKESIQNYEEYKKRKYGDDDEIEPKKKIQKGLDLSYWKVYTLTEEEALNEFRAKVGDQKYVSASFKCTECFKGFSQKDMLDRHTRSRHVEAIGRFQCWFCRMRYKWKCMLRKHMLQHYYKFECLRCDLVCMQENTAVLHEEFHSGVLKKCLHCEESFRHMSTYYTHLRTHRSEYVCTLCGSSFVSDAGLHQHKKLKHIDYEIDSPDDDEEVHTFCAKCDINFETRKAYEEHIFHSAMHAETNSNGDIIATKKILSKTEKAKFYASLRSIIKPDIGFPSIVCKRRKKKRIHRKPTTCYQCGKYFETQAAYMKHHLKEHPRTSFYSPADRHICEICGASLAPGSVAVHLNIHTRETIYTCDTCGRQFPTSVGLKRHLVTHTGEKRFVCAHCDKRFTQSNSLKLHINTFHFKHPYPKRNRSKKKPEQKTTVEAGVNNGESNHNLREPDIPEPQMGIEPVPNAVPLPTENAQYLRL